MNRSLFHGLALVAAGSALFSSPRAGQAAGPQPARFTTFDGVQIHGKLYLSGAGGNAPCVILLHEIGSDSAQPGLVALAEKLQPNFSVLTFDFRGHGGSTNVDKTFWNQGANQVIKGANRNKATISFKDFPKSYYPMLVNDICAARLFLDRENNAGRCNSSNIIPIGLGDGATLGALWITSEWKRPALRAKPLFPGVVVANGPPEGKDVACAVWVSMSPTIPAATLKLGGMKMPIAYWFTQLSPELKKEIPMSFICGEKDFVSRQLAQNVLAALKNGKGTNRVSSLTGAKHMAKTGAKGAELVKSEPDTSKYILKYLEVTLDKRDANQASRRRTLPEVPQPVSLARFLASGSEGLGPSEPLTSAGLELRTARALSVADVSGRRQAIVEARKLGKPDKETLSLLRKSLKDEHPDIRALAADVLLELGVQPTTRNAALNEALKQGDPYANFWLADACHDAGPNPNDAVAPVLKALRNPDAVLRARAAAVLGILGVDPGTAVPGLAGALADADFDVRCSAIRSLRAFGPNARAAVAALAPGLKDKDAAIRTLTAGALARIGPDALPVLKAALADPDEDTRAAAAHALGRIGPNAREATPELRKMLKDESAFVRQVAGEALARVDLKANAAEGRPK